MPSPPKAHLGLRGGLLRVQPSLHAGLVRQLARADARIRRLLSCSLQALLKSTEPVHGAAEQPGAPEPNGGALRVPLSDAARALTSRRARFRRTRWSRGTLGERVAPTAPLRPSELFGEVKRALSTCDGLRSAGLGVAGLSWAARLRAMLSWCAGPDWTQSSWAVRRAFQAARSLDCEAALYGIHAVDGRQTPPQGLALAVEQAARRAPAVQPASEMTQQHPGSHGSTQTFSHTVVYPPTPRARANMRNARPDRSTMSTRRLDVGSHKRKRASARGRFQVNSGCR
eukprot:356387-Chlamydomonas_euryale.AAC.7